MEGWLWEGALPLGPCENGSLEVKVRPLPLLKGSVVSELGLSFDPTPVPKAAAVQACALCLQVLPQAFQDPMHSVDPWSRGQLA